MPFVPSHADVSQWKNFNTLKCCMCHKLFKEEAKKESKHNFMLIDYDTNNYEELDGVKNNTVWCYQCLHYKTIDHFYDNYDFSLTDHDDDCALFAKSNREHDCSDCNHFIDYDECNCQGEIDSVKFEFNDYINHNVVFLQDYPVTPWWGCY